MNAIRYKAGYKYQLVESHTVLTAIRPAGFIMGDFLTMTAFGELTVKAGYAWDGPSGPVIDTPKNLRAAMIHDALYQLLRLGVLPKADRKAADQEFKRILIEDGVNWLTAQTYYLGLRWFAAFAAEPKSRRQVLLAPPVPTITEGG